MTVLFHDIKRALPGTHVLHRPIGVNFDEILYADDTLLVSQSTRTMNKLLASVEEEGAKYGIRLNKPKCQLLAFGPESAVKFLDGAPVPKTTEAVYLGCRLNNTHNTHVEVKLRIRAAAATLRQAHIFWRNSSATLKFELRAVEAILFAKILYGLESAELTESSLQALDTFQLKCYRKVLHMDTTYINRNNTNAAVFRRVWEVLCGEHTHRRGRCRRAPMPPPPQPLKERYTEAKLKFFLKVVTAPPTDPIHSITFDPCSLTSRTHHPRRVGRPKQKWATESAKEIWYRHHKAHHTLPEPPFDPTCRIQQEIVKGYASDPRLLFPNTFLFTQG
jgi:hypothetical protein